MSGDALSSFTTFVATTGPSYLTGPEDVVNEAVKNNYLLGKFLKGSDMSEVLQGGESIKDFILFDDNGSYENYQPNATFTPANPQLGNTWSIPWRFSKFDFTYTNQEIMLNGGSRSMSKNSRHQAYKKLKRIKEQAAWTAGLNGMEDDLTAVPSNSAMELASGSQPYSLFTFITEDTTNYHPTGFTTVQGIDPATESKWRNQVSTYDHTQPFDDTSGIIAAFDDMIEEVRFEPPPTRQQYFENDKLNKMSILTSKQGLTLYKQAIRASNDRLLGGTSASDPAYTNPAYAGIDVKKIDNLSSAAVYTSAAEADGEPRFYWVNANYMKVVFHTERYFVKEGPLRHPNQPFTYVCYYDCWWNLCCRSRNRQGIVAPTSPSN